MVDRRRRIFVRASALLLLAVGVWLPGCASNDQYYDETMANRRPRWLDSLKERTRRVPPEAIPNGPIATPTVIGDAQLPQGGGEPRSLTERLGAPPERVPDPAKRRRQQPPAAPAAATRPVVVQVGGLFSGADPAKDNAAEPKAPPPSKSPLEKMYGGDVAKEPSRDLQQFGYAFFQRPGTSADAFPLSDAYVVRPGDVVNVSLAGTLEGVHELTVLRNGTINIPKVGGIPIAGLQVNALEKTIQNFIFQRGNRREVRVSVSMGKVRGFPVQVVGEVVQPGIVEVTGRATVLTALAFAGGPRKSGSLRRVTIRRNGQPERVVDLYQFLLNGATEKLEYLRPDDTIVVPPIGPTVAVAGLVHRPGIYEALPKQKLDVAAALDLAGGLTPFTFTSHAQIERTIAGKGRERIDLKLDDKGLVRSMSDGELLLVGAVHPERKRVVRLTGEVVRPGDYEFRPGMKISDLLALGNGLTVDAYLPQAFLSRQVGKVEKVTLVPERSSNRTARRVQVIDLAKAYKGDPEHDVMLMPLDQLEVISQTRAVERPTVTVMGAVRRPGVYELTVGLRVSQLIAIAGNLTSEAYYDEAELIRRRYDPKERQLGVTRMRFDLRRALAPDSKEDPTLANFDQLIVRTLTKSEIKATIRGEVRFPGTYVLPKGARISDLIAAAGGALDNAELRASIFTRPSVQKLQRERFEHLKEKTRGVYESVLEQMVMSGQPPEGLAARLALDQTKELLERMDNYQCNGRVVIRFLEKEFPKSEFNLTLMPGDHLTIPPRRETVSIMGHVFNPGSFVARRGLRVQDLVRQCGGITEEGDHDRIYVIRADGVVQSVEQSSGELKMTAQLAPGDVVLVPREPLSRTLGHRLADLLFLARRAAETTFMLSKLGTQADLNFSTVTQEGLNNDVNVIDNTLLRK